MLGDMRLIAFLIRAEEDFPSSRATAGGSLCESM